MWDTKPASAWMVSHSRPAKPNMVEGREALSHRIWNWLIINKDMYTYMHPPEFITSYCENISHEYVLLCMHNYNILRYYHYTMYQRIHAWRGICTWNVKPLITFVAYQMTRFRSIAQYTCVCVWLMQSSSSLGITVHCGIADVITAVWDPGYKVYNANIQAC